MVVTEIDMPVPGYQEFMLPLLKIAGDSQEHTFADAMERLARQMEISEADRDILLPSGTQTRFYNRVIWAITYLYKSQLLERVGRGRFKVAARGLEVLKKNPARIDNGFLSQFEEFQAFITKRPKQAWITHKGDEIASSETEAEVTPR